MPNMMEFAHKQSETRTATRLPRPLSRRRISVTAIRRTLGILCGATAVALSAGSAAHAQQWIQGSIGYSIFGGSATAPDPSTLFFSGYAIPYGGPDPTSPWTAVLTAPPGYSIYNQTSTFTAMPGFGLTYRGLPFTSDPYTLTLTSVYHPGYVYTATIYPGTFDTYQAVNLTNFTLLWAVSPPNVPSAQALGAGPWTVAYRLHTTAPLTASQLIQIETLTSPSTANGGAQWNFGFPTGDSTNPTVTITKGAGYVPVTTNTEYDWLLVHGTTINVADPAVQAQVVNQHIQTLPPH